MQSTYQPCFQKLIDHLGTIQIADVDIVQLHQLFQVLPCPLPAVHGLCSHPCCLNMAADGKCTYSIPSDIATPFRAMQCTSIMRAGMSVLHL